MTDDDMDTGSAAAPPVDAFAALATLLAVVADPKAAEKRLADLRAETAAVERARADLAEAAAAQEAALAARRAALDEGERALRAGEAALARDLRRLSLRKAELDAEGSVIFSLRIVNANLPHDSVASQQMIVVQLLRNLSAGPLGRDLEGVLTWDGRPVGTYSFSTGSLLYAERVRSNKAA